MILISGGRPHCGARLLSSLLVGLGWCAVGLAAHGAAPSPGGDIIATNPAGGATTITEDDGAPGAANIRISPTTLADTDPGETPDAIRLISITGGTVAQGDGSAITLGASGTILDLTAGDYDARFTPAPNRDTAATIQYVVVDPGGVSDSAQSTITVNITAVNDDAPATGGNITATNTSGGAISINEDAAAPGAANIRVTPTVLSDPDTVDHPPTGIRLLSFTGGTVAQANGSAITLGASGTVLTLTSGRVDLRFTPAPNRDTAVTIPYVVVDGSGVADSPSSNITVNITASADPPSPGGNITATAPGGGATSITEDAPAPGAANIRLTPTTLSDPDTGQTPDSIRILSVTGGTVTQGGGGAITLGASGTVLTLTAGNVDLRFTPAANRDTAALISYVVVDPAGVADSTASTATVNITPAPDAPAAGGNITATAPGGGATSITEDAPAPGAANIRITPTTLSDPDTGETPNSIRLLAFTGGTVTQSDGGAIVLGASGTILTLTGGNLDLRFTPDADRDTAVTIPYVVVDPGGATDSASSNITVNITAVNDAPSAANGTLADILEDAANPAGASVTSLFGGSFTDVDGTFAGIAVVSNPQLSAQGVWQYSPPTSPGTTWFAIGNVTDTASAPNALVLGPTTLIRFLPATDFSGAVTSIGVRVLDNSYGGSFSTRSGVNQNRVTLNTATNGTPTAISAVAYTITHNVTPDNDPPAPSLNNALTVNQGDSGTITNALLLYTDSDDTPANLTYTVVTGPANGILNLGASFTQAAINSNSLTYNHGGTATQSDSFTFNVRDDDLATTANATFNIIVNLRPTVATPIADLLVNESAPNSVISLLANFDDAEDGAGGLTFTVQSTTGTIFNGTPTISGSNLTIAYPANTPGVGTITVRATDSGGAFVDDTFQVTVNDRPVANADAGNTNEGTAVVIDVLLNDTDSDGTLVPASVVVTSSPAQGATSVNTTNGRITYTPSGDFNGADAFQYTVNDNRGATSPAATVSVTVNPVNDAPTLTLPGTTQLVAEGGSLEFGPSTGNAITVGDVDADDTAQPAGGIRVALSATLGTFTLSGTDNLASATGNGTANVTFDATVANAVAALNGLVYTPNPLVNGAETLTVGVNDKGNTGAGGALSQSGTISVTIAATNNPPVIAVPGAQTVVEDQTTGISGIGVSDADAGGGLLTVTLSVGQGRISVNPSASGGVTSGNITGNNTSSVTLGGTLTQLNNTLPTVSFTTAQDNTAAQTLTVTANDNGNSGGPAESDTKTIAITVSPRNDNPTFSTFPGTQTIAEDTDLFFSTANGNRIQVSDVDLVENNPGGTLRATLTVSNGTLTLAGTTGLTSLTGNGTATLSFAGALTNANNALNGLRYRGAQDFNGPVTLTATINDQGNTGAGGGTDVQQSVTINVGAVNDAPVIGVPGAQSVDEDTNLPFSVADGNAISVTDVDADEAPGDVNAGLSVSNGTLTLATTAGLTSVTGNGTATIAMAGPPTALNTALDGLVYRGNTNFNGADSLSITASDNGNTGGGPSGSDAKVVSISVNAVNNAPVLALPGAQTITEDILTPITGISVADVDAGTGALVLSLGVGAGRLRVNGALAGGIDALSIGNNDSSAITLTGSLAQLNITLPSLTFRTATNNRTNQTLTVNVNDGGNTGLGGARTATGNVALNIIAINDDPALSLPGARQIDEEETLILSTAHGNAISVSDPDVAEAPGELRLTLSVAHGRLSLATTAGITLVSGTGLNDASVTFTGVVASVNTALNGLSYQPDVDFNTGAGGSEAISITVSDQGFTGLGGGGNLTGTVPIQIAAVNDAPVLTLPGARAVNEDTDLVFSGTVSISDVDLAEAPGGEVEVSLAVTNGALNLASTSGLTFTAPATGTGDASMTFRGAPSEVNSALNGLRYRAALNYNGPDTLQVTVSDLGNTGAGGARTALGNVAITVVPVNDAPTATAVELIPAEPLRSENLTARYTYGDVDGDGESDTTLRWFKDGALQSAFNNLTTVPNTATVEGEVWFFRVTPGDGTTSGATVQSNSVTIRPVADLQVFIARTPAVVVPGEPVSYTIQARNLGPSPVTGAEVRTTLPAALTNVAWSCADCGTSGTGALAEPLNLTSGQVVEFGITADVDPAAVDALTVSAEIIAPALVFETAPGNNTATNSTTVSPEATLSATITADRTTAQPGELIEYTVTATNQGPSDARGVQFRDQPDPNTTLEPESVSTSLGAVVQGGGTDGGGVLVNVGTLPLGETVMIRYRVRVASPFPASGRRLVCTRGEFTGEPGNPDVNFPNVSPDADACTDIATIILLTAANTDAIFVDGNADGAANPGDTIRYTIAIANDGNGGANNVRYTQPAFANGTLVMDSVTTVPDTASVAFNGGAMEVDLGPLEGSGAEGSQAAITFNVIIANPLAPGQTILVNQGALDYDERPAGTEPVGTDDPDAVVIEGSDVVRIDGDGNIIRPAATVTRIVTSSNLAVRLSDDIARTGEKRPGEVIHYTATIENRGNVGASGLTFQLPFRDGEISQSELEAIEGGNPLSDIAASLLANFNALDTDDSAGLSDAELDGSFFALTDGQFNEIDTNDARTNLLANSIMVNNAARANEGTNSELRLSLGALNGRNPDFVNGPTVTITFSVQIEAVLRAGVNSIRYQGVASAANIAGVPSDDPETINVAADATLTSVRAVPQITIVPDILTIDFGDQDIDDGPTPFRTVEITNNGTASANLTLGFVGLEGANLSDFTIASDSRETSLAPGRTRRVELAFDPRSIGNKRASLRIESDDPDDGAIDVNLSGRALDSEIRVTPSSLDFKKRNLLAGPSSPQSVSIINDGLGILTLDSVSLACGPDIFPVMTEARFDELDLNGDGVLTRGVGARRELEDAIDLFDVAEELIARFAALDTDATLSISPAELDDQYPFLTETRFLALDNDSSGRLNAAELDLAAVRAEQAARLTVSFADFDTAAPEGLDFSEAQSILPDLTELEFLVLDADGDGVLLRAELAERRKLALLAAQLQTDFTGLDGNRDGSLTTEEINVFIPLLTPGRFAAIDTDADEALSQAELNAVNSVLADSIAAQFNTLDTDGSGGLTEAEINATCAFEILSDSGESSLETAQSRLVRIVFDPSTEGTKVGTLRVEANQTGLGTPIVSKVSLFGIGNRTPRIVGQNPVTTAEDTPVTIILDNLIVDAPLLRFPEEVTLAFQPLPADANYRRDGNAIIPNRDFNGVLFVPVTVRDGNIDSNIWNLRIDVSKVNDPPTGIALDNTTISENQPVNTPIGRFTTSDPDLGDLHLYTLVPDDPTTDDDDFVDNEFFGIVANQLVSKVVFDFETRKSYTVLVRSTDPAGRAFQRAFNITIIDQPNDEDDAVASEALLENFHAADTDGSGGLSFEEAVALLPGFTRSRFDTLNLEVEISLGEIESGIAHTSSAQSLFDGFDLADTDGDGALTLAEARRRVPGLTEAAYDYMNGTISDALTPEELQAAILINGDLDQLRESFTLLDADGSGSLTLDELPGGLRALNRARFGALDTDPGLSQRELAARVTCRILEGTVALIQPSGDLLAPPGAAVLDVRFIAEAGVNVESACAPEDLVFTYDIGAESILITDLAEYFLQNFVALDADFGGTLSEPEVEDSRLGITPERFSFLDFNGSGALSREELEARVFLSDIATVLLENFAALNTDNSTGLSQAEADDANAGLDGLRYAILDLNDNGVLTRAELEAEIDLPGYLLDNFQTADTDTDGVLGLAEVRALLPGLSATRYDNLDGDGDGGLLPAELLNANDFDKHEATAHVIGDKALRKQIRGTEPALFSLPINSAYRVRVTATLPATGQTVRSADYTFEIRPGSDVDENGYLDFPFEELVNDGSRWERVVAGAGCGRAVLMHAWKGTDIPGRDIEAFVANPARPAQQITVKVPHGLAEEGEEAVLLLAVACSPEALYSRELAGTLADLPEDIVAGTPWIAASIVVREAGAPTFAPISAARLEALPVELAVNGLTFSPEDAATFFTAEGAVDSPEASGIVQLPTDAPWSSLNAADPAAEAGTLSATLSRLGTVVALESLKPPIIAGTPDLSRTFDLGSVRVNESVDRILTITNLGGERLVGTVELRDATGAFFLVGVATYNLGHGETHEVLVRFSPPDDLPYAATLTLSGDPGGLVTVPITGNGTPAKGLGCGPAYSDRESPLGGLLVIALTLGLLCAGTGRAGSRKES